MIEFGAWSAAQWQLRALARTELMSAALAEGVRAYALEQVEHMTDEGINATVIGQRYIEHLVGEGKGYQLGGSDI